MKSVPLLLRRAVLCLAIVFFILCILHIPLREPGALQQGYILCLMVCALGAMLFASGRIAIALVISGGAFVAVKAISLLKQQYLESPLMPADVVYFARSSLVETLQHYPHLRLLAVAALVLVPLVLLAVWLLDTPLFARWRRWPRLSLRLAGAVGFALAFWWLLQPEGPFAPVYRKGLWNTLSDKAHITNFFTTIHDTRAHLPVMADDRSAVRDWAPTAAGVPGTILRPDIVEVLEESTFDPSSLDGCTIAQCRATMFQPDADTKAQGLLRTHTFGGGTWVSEFSAYSGMPQDIFGSAGIYAPFVLAPRVRDSLPMQLRRLGYRTIAIYPVVGSFLDARNAYREYGFDEFDDIHDLGLIEWHASDAQLFAAAKKIYDREKKPGQPIFLMILTMEQHGPHDSHPLSSLPTPFDRGVPGLPADQQLNLATYLSRLHDSDVGMTQLERDFLRRPQPTVLVHFGDHQPSFGNLIRAMPRALPAELKPYRDNLTYYMVKANFAGPPLQDYPMRDIAYLPSMVLQASGLPEDAYFAALSTLEKRCQGRYTDCPDKALVQSYYAWVFRHLKAFD